jgi:hypothetical protein
MTRVYAIAGERAKASGRKIFFFEKKKQKTYDCFGFGPSGWRERSRASVFWFFSSKKNHFLSLSWLP